jgi:hypothetical protein
VRPRSGQASRSSGAGRRAVALHPWRRSGRFRIGLTTRRRSLLSSRRAPRADRSLRRLRRRGSTPRREAARRPRCRPPGAASLHRGPDAFAASAIRLATSAVPRSRSPAGWSRCRVNTHAGKGGLCCEVAREWAAVMRRRVGGSVNGLCGLMPASCARCGTGFVARSSQSPHAWAPHMGHASHSLAPQDASEPALPRG